MKIQIETHSIIIKQEKRFNIYRSGGFKSINILLEIDDPIAETQEFKNLLSALKELNLKYGRN